MIQASDSNVPAILFGGSLLLVCVVGVVLMVSTEVRAWWRGRRQR